MMHPSMSHNWEDAEVIRALQSVQRLGNSPEKLREFFKNPPPELSKGVGKLGQLLHNGIRPPPHLQQYLPGSLASSLSRAKEAALGPDLPAELNMQSSVPGSEPVATKSVDLEGNSRLSTPFPTKPRPPGGG